jgi:hypothetical protein
MRRLGGSHASPGGVACVIAPLIFIKSLGCHASSGGVACVAWGGRMRRLRGSHA